MADKPKATISELLALWALQESLLQQYRTIFITMQSIFIAVGATLLGAREPWVPMALLTILGAYCIWLWVSICRARGESVYLTQFFVICAEQGDVVVEPLARLKQFQAAHCESERDPRFLALRGSKTRRMMEFWLPLTFGVAWALLWVSLTLQHYMPALLPRGAGG